MNNWTVCQCHDNRVHNLTILVGKIHFLETVRPANDSERCKVIRKLARTYNTQTFHFSLLFFCVCVYSTACFVSIFDNSQENKNSRLLKRSRASNIKNNQKTNRHLNKVLERYLQTRFRYGGSEPFISGGVK